MPLGQDSAVINNSGRGKLMHWEGDQFLAGEIAKRPSKSRLLWGMSAQTSKNASTLRKQEPKIGQRVIWKDLFCDRRHLLNVSAKNTVIYMPKQEGKSTENLTSILNDKQLIFQVQQF